MNQTSRLRKLSITLFTLMFFAGVLAGQIHAAETKYTCPMHPHYISDTFGTCPICNMDLVEIGAGVAGAEAEDEHGLHLPEHMVQRTGVRTAPAETAYFGRAIRSFGEVVVNQRLQIDVSLRVEGWIEDLVVNAEGDEVVKGSLLFKFYSPQLIAAQQDYLTALSSGNKDRVQVTEDRLLSLGVQQSVISRIKKAGKPIRNLPFYAAQNGRVERIAIRQGSYLRPGVIAMQIQGYDQVWIQVNLAEQDISFVKKDSRVNVDFPNLAVSKENVKIDYIAPTVDPDTRTAQLRLIMDNPEGYVRPGAYADVMIMTDIAPRLAIPYEGVLQNKEGSYVILQRDDGTYQAREVKTGLQYKGLVHVEEGLAAGEQVVVSGHFLIDSESSLRESFKRMEKLALSLAKLEVSEHQLVLLNHLVEGALYAHEQLAAGNLPQPNMLDAAEQSARKLIPEVKGTRLAFVVDDFLAAIEKRNENITISSWQTLLADSTASLTPWVVEGRPRYYAELGLTLFTTVDGRAWIQFKGEMQNPYGSVEAVEHRLEGDNVSSS